ncbi:MAG: hypothetical protein ABSH53_14255 [Holophaga sp.]|jgi:hypothetical protein
MELDIKPSLLLDALDPVMPPGVRKGLAKLVRTALSLPEQELRAHKGIHLHRIQNQFDPATGLQLESMEVTEGARLKAMVQEGRLVLLSLHTDHDETYRMR